ncbi:MAG: hypothetical protein PHC64_09350 [Candidatus Gastranaerophilales bacterium]|nr:hypothetical protein [Candidatus Gastranaerophilales bacterium]
MQVKINQIQKKILDAIKILSQDKKDINPFSVSKVANISWLTSKKYLQKGIL